MNNLFLFDSKIRKENSINIIAGFDEAGRGPLAGPVFCAGVILKPDFDNELINDSKQLSEKRREELYSIIIDNSLAYSIKCIDVETIDSINILESSRLGMQQCYLDLLKKINIDYAITDYMKIKTSCPILSIPKGDATSLSVAASSILAKVSRDRYMKELAKKYPNYSFDKNKGYGTKEHLVAISKYGIIPLVHRKSFEPIKSILEEKNKIHLF